MIKRLTLRQAHLPPGEEAAISHRIKCVLASVCCANNESDCICLPHCASVCECVLSVLTGRMKGTTLCPWFCQYRLDSCFTLVRAAHSFFGGESTKQDSAPFISSLSVLVAIIKRFPASISAALLCIDYYHDCLCYECWETYTLICSQRAGNV